MVNTIKGRRWNDLSFSVLRYLMPPPTLTLTLTQVGPIAVESLVSLRILV